MKNAALDEFFTALSGLESALAVLPPKMGRQYYCDLEGILKNHLPSIYESYDGYVAGVLQAEGKQVKCRSGCSACCRHFVTSVEPFETLAIHFRAKEMVEYPDLLFSAHDRVSKFKQILGKERQDEEAEDRALHRYFLRGIPCTFLGKDGECGIYESRPMSCRMFFSESSPRFCAGKAIVSPWNKNFQVELPDEAEEALARCSALLAKLELPEELFAGVLEANELFGQFDI